MIKFLKFLTYFLLFVIIAVLISAATGYDRTRIPSDLSGKTVEINHLKIRVYQGGEGKDVLLLHGLPGSIEDWEPLLKNIPKGYRVTAYDRPGHGYSQSADNQSSLSANTEIATALISQLNLKNVTVVGHSYGGGVALNLTLEHPNLIKACVLIDPVAYPVPDIPFDPRPLTIPVVGRGLATLTMVIMGRRVEKNVTSELFFPNNQLVPLSHLKTVSKIWSQAKVITTSARELSQHYLDFERVSSRYHQIYKPVFIIHGVEDRVIPARQSVRLSRQLPNAELLLLEHIGHEAQYNRADLVIQAIQKLNQPQQVRQPAKPTPRQPAVTREMPFEEL